MGLFQSSANLGDLASLIAAAIAGGGLALGISRFIHQLRQGVPRLRVTLKNGFLTFGADTSDVMFIISVDNPSKEPIHVSSVSLEFNRKVILLPSVLAGTSGTTGMPFTLEPGRNETFWTPLRELAIALRAQGIKKRTRLRACATSQVGDDFRSPPYRLNVADWTSSNPNSN